MLTKPGTLLVIAATLASAAVCPAAGAQTPPVAEELPRIRISDPNRDMFKLGLPAAIGDAELSRQATDIERRDLEIVGLFRLLDPASFPPALQNEGLAFSSANWSQVGAQGVVKLRVAREGGEIAMEGRLYQVGRGDAAVATKTYRGGELRTLVHQWANDVIEQFTGTKGIFGSRIAFALSGKTGEIATVGLDGADMTILTKMKSECLLPAFAPNGKEVAFTSYLRDSPDLWIVSAAGGRARRVSARSGLNTGAAWTPDSSGLVMTLSYEGNAELYQVSPTDGKVLKRLTQSPSIDSSPSFSPDGSQLAFVSDRQGSPQIYVMPAAGGAPRRLTYQGSYNQTPRWNPRTDKPVIAFTGRDEKATFDIFVYDTKTQKVDRLTQGRGSNSDPAWSPDGRLLAYASTRGGIFVMNVETRLEFQIWRGNGRSPSWGPAPGTR